MQSKKLAGAKPGVPSQRFLDISEIREDVAVMKDGTLRAVLLVSSINFALKSMDEQNAIVQAYMQFLNAIDFPIQIVIQSRRMNIDTYLRRLSESERTQTNELLRRQIGDYRDYVRQLVELAEIMQKKFSSSFRLTWRARGRTKGVFCAPRRDSFTCRRDERVG